MFLVSAIQCNVVLSDTCSFQEEKLFLEFVLQTPNALQTICFSPSNRIAQWWVGLLLTHLGVGLQSRELLVTHSIALYYISLLSGLGNIDDQNRNPNINNRDHLVGRPTRWLPTTGWWLSADERL